MDVRMRDQQFEPFLCYNRDIPEHTEFNNFCFGTNFSTKFSHQLTLLYSKHFLKPKPVRQADGSITQDL